MIGSYSLWVKLGTAGRLSLAGGWESAMAAAVGLDPYLPIVRSSTLLVVITEEPGFAGT